MPWAVLMSARIHRHTVTRPMWLSVAMTVAGIVIFGISALWTVLTCIAATVLSEFLFNLCAGKKQTVGDLSAVVTGLLLALNLSTNVPL